jgi:hypothetical protein
MWQGIREAARMTGISEKLFYLTLIKEQDLTATAVSC